jgi:predicted nucleic acid-binding protein
MGLTEGILAGSWRREHARRGITLHQADCLIAAAAVGIGAALATANVDDFPMPEVRVEEWPVGT